MSKIDVLRAEDVFILSWTISEYELDLFLNCTYCGPFLKSYLLSLIFVLWIGKGPWKNFNGIFQIK